MTGKLQIAPPTSTSDLYPADSRRGITPRGLLMRRTCLLLAVAALSVWGLPALAGTQYKVVAMNGKEKGGV